jgi:hypothetical protein
MYSKYGQDSQNTPLRREVDIKISGYGTFQIIHLHQVSGGLPAQLTFQTSQACIESIQTCAISKEVHRVYTFCIFALTQLRGTEGLI